MSNRSFTVTRKSKISNHSSLNKPTKYRVIYKSRSGALDDVSSASTHSLRAQNFKMNITDTSFCTNELIPKEKSIQNQTLSSLKPHLTNPEDV